MKKLSLLIAAFLLICSTTFAQKTKKELNKDIKAKASKEARNEAKKLQKLGWSVAPGSLPLEKLLQMSYEKEYDRDEKGMPIYLVATGNQVGQTKTAAEMAAMELAKISLAGQIQTNINSLVTANVANSQLSTEDAATVSSVLQSSKNLISTELGYIDPSFKIYRTTGDKNIEVETRIFYDRRQSMDIARKVVKKELTDKLKVNEATLEKIMGIAN